MDRPEAMEQLGDRLCTYCPLPEESQGVHCYGGEPIMCEGSHCKEAYENYLEDFNDEQIDKEITKIQEDNMYKEFGIIPNQIYHFELKDCTSINGVIMNFDSNTFCIKGIKGMYIVKRSELDSMYPSKISKDKWEESRIKYLESFVQAI